MNAPTATTGHTTTGHTQPHTTQRIVLRRVPLRGRIGVYDWEQTEPQPMLLDLEFDLPGTAACTSDALTDTVDYAEVIDQLRALALSRPHRLVEAMAHSMCELLRQRFGLTRLRLGLAKLAPFPGAEVGIVVERHGPPPLTTPMTPAATAHAARADTHWSCA